MSTTDGSEHYWPNIKKAILQNPAGQPSDQHMKPQCPVCFAAFDITTFSRPSANAPTCVVLFCGHVMCRGCLEQTEEHSLEDEKKKCPCCRTSLACTVCGQASKTFTVPDANTTPNEVFNVPLTMPENRNTNVKPKCHRCAAEDEWLDRIDNGDHPRGAETIEPGAARFFYGTVRALESEGRDVTPESVSSAFRSVTNDEYQMLTSRRNEFMSQWTSELETINPWFGSGFGRDRYESPSGRNERRRETDDDDYWSPRDSPLDSPLDTQARLRRREFEERRRMHDRLPEERSLQDQLSGLSLGGGDRSDRFESRQRLDPYGRSQRGDGRSPTQQRFDESRFDEGPRRGAGRGYGDFDEPSFGEGPRRDTGMSGRAYGGFDEPSFDERPRRDAGMGGRSNYGDFGGGRETGRDTFSGAQYGRDTGNPYSDQRGRDTGNGTPHARNTGNPLGGTQYGGDADITNRFLNTQRDDDPSSRAERGRGTRRPRPPYERYLCQDGSLMAEFDRNPEAQRQYQENIEKYRPQDDLAMTDEERNDPLLIRWRKEAATQQVLDRANRGRDGRPSERRR